MLRRYAEDISERVAVELKSKSGIAGFRTEIQIIGKGSWKGNANVRNKWAKRIGKEPKEIGKESEDHWEHNGIIPLEFGGIKSKMRGRSRDGI